MDEKLSRYLDGLFAPYEDTRAVKDLKEELLHDLNEKYRDYKNQGYEDETAYQMTIGSIGDISEIMESISAKTNELLRVAGREFSATDLRNSDLKGVSVQGGKFTSMALQGSDFSGSDLTGSLFKWCDLRDVRFDGANLSDARFLASILKNASMSGCILDNTSFKECELSGACFDNLNLIGTVFDNVKIEGTTFRNATLRNVTYKLGIKNKNNLKKAIFDNATMDKLTYAVLKSYGANLTGVTVI